jgi:lipid-A-disaccharide synthase-like uncharacterized protein
MAVILCLSMWIMLYTSKRVPATEGAAVMEMVVASHKIKVEQILADDKTFSYRILSGPFAGKHMTTPEYQAWVQMEANAAGREWYLRLFNVSTGNQFVWVAIGLGGQLIFSGRMLVQWLASEKSRKSVVPAAFWYLSLGGALMLTAYFIWRHDMVGLLGQTMGLVIYVRNIRLLRLDKARTEALKKLDRKDEAAGAVAGATPVPG